MGNWDNWRGWRVPGGAAADRIYEAHLDLALALAPQLNVSPESPSYDNAALLLEATAAGHGVALVRKVVARDILAARLPVRLPVRLSEIEHPLNGTYHFVRDPAAAPDKSAAARAFGACLAERLHGEFTEAKPWLS